VPIGLLKRNAGLYESGFWQETDGIVKLDHLRRICKAYVFEMCEQDAKTSPRENTDSQASTVKNASIPRPGRTMFYCICWCCNKILLAG
jgi:hypothetical protein